MPAAQFELAGVAAGQEELLPQGQFRGGQGRGIRQDVGPIENAHAQPVADVPEGDGRSQVEAGIESAVVVQKARDISEHVGSAQHHVGDIEHGPRRIDRDPGIDPLALRLREARGILEEGLEAAPIRGVQPPDGGQARRYGGFQGIDLRERGRGQKQETDGQDDVRFFSFHHGSHLLHQPVY